MVDIFNQMVNIQKELWYKLILWQIQTSHMLKLNIVLIPQIVLILLKRVSAPFPCLTHMSKRGIKYYC